MKPKSLRFVVFFFVLFNCSLLIASVPRQMSYQGKVTNVAGFGITDTLDIAFSLWNEDAAGDSLWGETQSDVPIIKGLFDVQLGSVNPIALSFDTTYWLQIIVDGDLLLPRTQITTSPYAFRAKYAESMLGGMNTDTIWSADKDPADTIVIMAQTKVHGELIADSIQAVGNRVTIDDHVDLHGCLFFYVGAAETLYTEGFESGDPPIGWEEVDRLWSDIYYVLDGLGYYPTEGTLMVKFADWEGDEETGEATLQQTLGFSSIGYSCLTLYLDMIHDTRGSSYRCNVYIGYSLNGVDWQDVDSLPRNDGTDGWATEIIDLPPVCDNQPEVFIRFYLWAGEESIYFDNLIITGKGNSPPYELVSSICGRSFSGNFIGDFWGDGSMLEGTEDDDWLFNGNKMYSKYDKYVGIGKHNPTDVLHLKYEGMPQGRGLTITGDILTVAPGVIIDNPRNSHSTDLVADDGSILDFRYGSRYEESSIKVSIDTLGNINVLGDITANAFIGDGSGLTNVPGDNLGNHIATQVLDMSGFDVNLNGGYLSGDGDAEGIYVDADGKVGIGTNNPYDLLHIEAFDSTDGDNDGVFMSIRNTCNAESSFCGIRFKNHSTDNDQLYKAGIVFQRTGTYGRGDVLFLNDNQGNQSNADLTDTRMVISHTGAVGIANRDPNYLLDMESTAGGYYSAADHNWHDASSIRWKENIRPISDALELINQFQGVRYEWKQEYGGCQDIGFIAEDVMKIIPEAVSPDPDNPEYASGMSYAKLTALLVEGIKEQQAMLGEQKKQIEKLETQTRDLITRIEALESQ